MQTIKNFFGHHYFKRYIWFYLAIIIVASFSFWAGLKYPEQTQPSKLDLTVPSWLQTVKTHPKKKALGNPDAPVKITEYVDLECPFCQRFSLNAFPRIIENYVSTGKVYYTVKHLPGSPQAHPNAMPGAIASECAANQGKFWEFKTLALSNRRYLSRETYLEIANSIDIPDLKKFKQCFIKQHEYSKVHDELKKAQKIGVKGTPTILINGKKIVGAQPFSRYKKSIEKAIAEKNVKSSQNG